MKKYKLIYEQEQITVPQFSEKLGFYTNPKKSKEMGKIRAKNTQPELKFRKALYSKSIRYRINNKRLPGKPDIVIKKYRLAIFIDGDFWHGREWESKKERIKSNRDFWLPKIERNMQRDKENTALLEILGYTVFRFWETDIKKDIEGCVNTILFYIKSRRED